MRIEIGLFAGETVRLSPCPLCGNTLWTIALLRWPAGKGTVREMPAITCAPVASPLRCIQASPLPDGVVLVEEVTTHVG